MDQNKSEYCSLFSIKKRTIAIIGAGPNGLLAARWALTCGLRPIIFERTGCENTNLSAEKREACALSSIGGAWRDNQGPCPGQMWPGMHTVSDRFTTTFFQGFPLKASTRCDPTRVPDGAYLTCEEVREYWREVATALGLLAFVKFGHEVVAVKRLEDDRWSVSTRVNFEDGTTCTTTASFDSLIIAIGAHSTPCIPSFPNLSSFKGRVLHGHSFPGPAAFEGRRVLVIGGSFSGLQQTAELVYKTTNTEVFQLVRRPCWIVPKYVTIDARHPSARILYSKEDKSIPTVEIPFSLVTRRRSNRGIHATDGVELRFDSPEACKKLNTNMFKICKDQLVSPAWTIDPNSETFYHTAVADEYPKLLAEKAPQYVERFHLLMGEEINNFNETGVILKSGLHIDNIDAVICCTGYKLSYEFFEDEVKSILEYEDRYSRTLPIILYLGTVRPELPNLAFIENPMTITGYYRELQVRYACYLFSARMTHPDINDPSVSKYLNEEREMRAFSGVDRFRSHYDFMGFSDAIAKEIGALPDFERLQTEDPALYALLVDGPFHQDHYNLQGFGTDPVAARCNIEAATRFIEERARKACEHLNSFNAISTSKSL